MELEEVEFANEAFYLAFEAKDFDAMAHLWSHEREIVCLHPGWPALIGRNEVLESWRKILSNPQQGQVSFFEPSIQPLSDESAVVVCYERSGDAVMVASNVFVAEQGTVRLVLHQAGYCAHPPVAG